MEPPLICADHPQTRFAQDRGWRRYLLPCRSPILAPYAAWSRDSRAVDGPRRRRAWVKSPLSCERSATLARHRTEPAGAAEAGSPLCCAKSLCKGCCRDVPQTTMGNPLAASPLSCESWRLSGCGFTRLANLHKEGVSCGGESKAGPMTVSSESTLHDMLAIVLMLQISSPGRSYLQYFV